MVSVEGQFGGSRSVAVTENEIRKYTQESIFNSVRDALGGNGLLKVPSSPWADADWQIGQFVDFTAGRIVVPLVSALSRLRVIAESFAFVTSELSVDRLQTHVPQLLQQLRSGAETDEDEDMNLDQVLSFLTETGEIARALAGVVGRLEAEAEESGLVDVVMFEDQMSVPQVVAVASLDRDYVDTKLLRRLGQGHFGVLGKVMRSPQPETAFNAFRNSMLGATNQLPVLLTRFHSRLFELPLLLGDGFHLEVEDGTAFFNFVGLRLCDHGALPPLGLSVGRDLSGRRLRLVAPKRAAARPQGLGGRTFWNRSATNRDVPHLCLVSRGMRRQREKPLGGIARTTGDSGRIAREMPPATPPPRQGGGHWFEPSRRAGGAARRLTAIGAAAHDLRVTEYDEAAQAGRLD